MKYNVQSVPAQKLAHASVESGLDGLVLLSPEMTTYALGIRVQSYALMRWRYTAALIRSSGLSAAFTVDMEESTLASYLQDIPVRSWREFDDDPMEVLSRLIFEVYGSGPLTLGIEYDFVPESVLVRLRELCPNIEWVSCERLVAECRIQKAPAELAKIEWLSRVSDNALKEALDGTRMGDSENQIGARIISSLYASGVSDHQVLIVASGERSQYPNIGPSDRCITEGDIVRVEVFAAADGYQAGVARTAVVKEPADYIYKLWKELHSASAEALGMLAPGVDPRDIYQTYLAKLGPDLRKQAIAFFGHGMGLDVHEPPFISAGSNDPILEGAIIGIEPFAMLPEYQCGLQVKDVVTVTSDGFKVLSDCIRGDDMFVID